ncbi:MAG: zinc-binding dehydrogenase [Akkermansiaceae bacterium]|nr:zinc-binding dehydrogenase [Armatimonadota bacterium]
MLARAVIATAPGKVAFMTINVPDPGPQDVVVRVRHSWISNGTEGSFIRGERIAGDTPRRGQDPLPFPHVPGYQKVGVVEWRGDEVTDLQIGDVVFATVSGVEGMFYTHGGHVSPAVTSRTQVWKLTGGVDPVSASGLVLTQVGYNAGTRPVIAAGDAAVILGDGMVGHWTAQTLQQRGARVLLAGRHDDRLSRFVCGDGDRVVNTRREDVNAVISEWAPEGLQVIADTVGSVADTEALLARIRHFGQVVSVGFYGTDGMFDAQKLREREVAFYAPAGWRKTRIEETLGWLAQGKLTTKPLLSHRFPVARAAEAYDLILNRQTGVLGVVLDWED